MILILIFDFHFSLGIKTIPREIRCIVGIVEMAFWNKTHYRENVLHLASFWKSVFIGTQVELACFISLLKLYLRKSLIRLSN